MSQFTVFPSPTPDLVNCLKYIIKNDIKIKQKSSVLSCFLCADSVSVFTMILHHTQNNDNLFAIWKKTQGIRFVLNVFTRFQTIANPLLFTVLPRPTENINNLYTIWHEIMLNGTKVSGCLLGAFWKPSGSRLSWFTGLSQRQVYNVIHTYTCSS